MDFQFKRRVQAAQQTQTQNVRPGVPNTPHTHPGLVSPPRPNNTQTGRTTGGPIRNASVATRGTRARGPPGTPSGRLTVPSTNISNTTTSPSATSPRRPSGSILASPSRINTRKSSGAGLPTSGAAGAARKKKLNSEDDTENPNLENLNSNQHDNAVSQNNSSITDSNANVKNISSETDDTNSNIPPSPLNNFPTTSLRSPGLKSPSKKMVYDRYIPAREGGLSEQFEVARSDAPTTPSYQRNRNMSMTPAHASQVADHYKMAQNQAHDNVIANELMLTNTHSPHENHRRMPSTPRRLFSFVSTTTHNTMHFDSPSRQIYAATPVSYESRNILLSPKTKPRTISKVPFKVLDAPDLRDDFYLNLVDWSSKNVLGVGLGSCVYLWSALTSKVTQLCDLGDNDSVTSINWISMGTHLAVGTDTGAIQIWDVQTSQRVRTMTGHTQRVGVLAWNDHILTSGSRDRDIYHRDVRTPEMRQHQLSSHTGEVCGLKWNSSGTQLASGGNDNKLMIWEKDATVPIYKFRDHTAAVKAIDWNPHQTGILASGGGTADRHIRFWNTLTGNAISATDTGSQVCNLAWSKTTNELVSTHGYSQNQVLVWKYPSMQQIASLSGHTFRVLYLALSPDGQTIVTGAGDETLRFWSVFQKSKSERRDDDDELTAAVSTIR